MGNKQTKAEYCETREAGARPWYAAFAEQQALPVLRLQLESEV